jgi:transposase
MEIPSAPAASAALERPAPVFVALELGKTRWLVGIRSPTAADKISRHSVAGGDSQGLPDLIARVRRQAAAQLGQAVAVVCCYEAGYDGFWSHRLLQANGIGSRTTRWIRRACRSTVGLDAPRRIGSTSRLCCAP